MENIGGSAFSDAGILRVESYDTVLDGIDDLSTGDNWSAPTMSFGKGGRLTFTGSNLEYTVPSYSKYEDTAIMEWTPNVASYTKDWNVQVDVHLANIEQSYNTGLYLFAFNSATTLKFITFEYRGLSVFEYMDYVYVGLTPGGVESGVYSSYGVRLDGPKPKNISSGDATVKISFNSATKELTMFYSTDGGSTWIQNYKVSVAPYSPYDWGMGDNSTFSIMFVGYSSNRNVSSGDAYLSNFEASSP